MLRVSYCRGVSSRNAAARYQVTLSPRRSEVLSKLHLEYALSATMTTAGRNLGPQSDQLVLISIFVRLHQ